MTGFPADWPDPGPINLAIHDLPHQSSTMEWWYVNGHCITSDDTALSFFAAFFRQAKGKDPATGSPQFAHSLTWAIHDVKNQKSNNVSRVDKSAVTEGLKLMRWGLGSKDPRLNRALKEILERGNVPKPDRIFSGNVFVGDQRLELEYADASFRKDDTGNYRLQLSDRERGLGCDLLFEPQRSPIRHGADGVVRGPNDETMFYYFIPRCRLTGSITCRGEKLELREGVGWYDHEFGFTKLETVHEEIEARLTPEERESVHADRRKRRDECQVAWNWICAHLDGGIDLTVYPLEYVHTGKPAGDWAILVDADGVRTSYPDIALEAHEFWQSTQTFFHYPIGWKLRIPSAELELEIRAAFSDQEFITLISKPSFWEGRVEVKGTYKGKPVSGLGYVERSGYAPYETLDGFFEEVSKVVRQSVERIIPLKLDYVTARNLIASKEKEHYMEGVDIEQYARAQLRPIREIVDRGGKGWRSYAAITCCDVVGGDSRDYVQWLALPEMMHVGSLIVDDVEDKSEVRRGGPTAHLLYGEAQAINSGTAAYFIGVGLLMSDKMSAASKLRLYDLYFDAIRAGHAGQALDIDGFDAVAQEAVHSGQSATLEGRVLAVHRLKTAAPAGCLARMGAIAGGGTEKQITGVGRFFEDVGLAFQIVDDVLNLRGFKGNLKAKAEDMVQGKVTLPVAKAMSRLPIEERRWLYETIKSKPNDVEVVTAIVDKLEICGAIEACQTHARDMIENSWVALQPLVEDSLAKMMLRAFCWFVLERHY
jgi:geranylgeranyl pyrophosphate synthase/predicted secreted hydrolase